MGEERRRERWNDGCTINACVPRNEKFAVTRADRPRDRKEPVDEFVSFIDKLLNTMDTDDEVDCPTEKMEYLDEKTPPPEKRRSQPPPLPPADDTEQLDIDVLDSLVPTQF